MTSLKELNDLDEKIEIDESLLSELNESENKNTVKENVEYINDDENIVQETPNTYQQPLQYQQPVQQPVQQHVYHQPQQIYQPPIQLQNYKNISMEEDSKQTSSYDDIINKGIYFIKFFTLIFIMSSFINSQTMLNIISENFTFLMSNSSHSYLSIFSRSFFLSLFILFFYYYIF